MKRSLLITLFASVAACPSRSEEKSSPPILEIDAKALMAPASPATIQVEGFEKIDLLEGRSPDGATRFPLQRVPGSSTFVMIPGRAANESGQMKIQLFPATGADFQDAVTCEEDKDTIRLTIGTRTLLHYRKTPSSAASENDPVYTRSGYIHPLNTPSGKTVTGDYPADHPHQHALFNAWTKTLFEGRPVNFWDQKKGKGRISYRETLDTFSGPVFGGFTVSQRHEDLTEPGNPRPVLEEALSVRAYQGGKGYFLLDIETRQKSATRSPLEIQQYHYGGMAIRGTSDWFEPDKDAVPPGSFLTSEGLGRIEGNHSRPNWVAMHGPLEGGHAGIAVFSHPGNFRAPQWVRLHPTKPYFVFTPMVEEGFSIGPDSPYLGRFRYVVFDGKPDPEFLNRCWQDYSQPTN